jgi:hypothetical protein
MNSLQDLFGLLQTQYDKEKSKGNMDEARQTGLDSLSERGHVVQSGTLRPAGSPGVLSTPDQHSDGPATAVA